MKALAAIAIMLWLVGCALAEKEALAPLPNDCQGAYVILPRNFIMDIEAEAEVRLNPAIYEFELFCLPDQARARLAKMPTPKDDWAIYELEGSFDELATPCGHNKLCLDAPARVIDWLE